MWTFKQPYASIHKVTSYKLQVTVLPSLKNDITLLAKLYS